MTRQKARHLERVPLEKRITGQVRLIAEKSFVVSIEDHFAGYFNELGFFITVSDEAPDSAVIDFRNELLVYLKQALPSGTAPFSWQVGIVRKGKTIEIIFPGDNPRSNEETLSPL